MKNDFDILNEVTIDFSEYDDLPLNDIEKQEIKKRMKNKIKTKGRFFNQKIIASVLSFILLGSVALTNDNVFASIKKFIFNSPIDSFFNRPEGSIDNYKSVIGKTITDKDISITLNEVAFDADKIIISTQIDASTLKEDFKNLNIFPQVYIDGKEAYSYSGSLPKSEKKMIFNICNSFEFKDLDLTKHHEITYEIDQILLNNGETSTKIIFGKWKFKFKADGEKIDDKIKVLSFEKEVQLSDDVKIKLHQVTMSPLSFRTTFAIYGESFKYVTLYVEDDLGNRYKVPVLEGHEINNTTECNLEFSPNINAKKIKLIPNLRGQLMYDKAIEINLEDLKNTIP